MFCRKRYAMLYIALAVLGGMFWTASARALYLHSGRYTFDVRVTNEHFRPIGSARGSAYVFGDTARLSIEARGYRSEQVTVWLRENEYRYTVRVTLRSLPVFPSVEDEKGRRIKEAFFREDPFGAAADDYAAAITLPRKGFERFRASDVSVTIDGAMVFALRCRVEDLASTRIVHLSFPRESFPYGSSYPTIRVRIPSDKGLEASRRLLRRKLAFLLKELEEKGETRRCGRIRSWLERLAGEH